MQLIVSSLKFTPSLEIQTIIFPLIVSIDCTVNNQTTQYWEGCLSSNYKDDKPWNHHPPSNIKSLNPETDNLCSDHEMIIDSTNSLNLSEVSERIQQLYT